MYDFDAGDLSLNFANTMDWHTSSKPVENLETYADLVTWGLRAGILSPGKAEELKQAAVDHPQEADDMLKSAIQLREAIYHIFSYRYLGKVVPKADISLLTKMVCQANSHLSLVPKGESWCWQLPSNMVGVNLILWPVARAAADLLTSEKVSLVRVCEDDRGCGYLFVDETKNHSRRWCSMESCGNRAKARRHYSRIQAN